LRSRRDEFGDDDVGGQTFAIPPGSKPTPPGSVTVDALTTMSVAPFPSALVPGRTMASSSVERRS